MKIYLSLKIKIEKTLIHFRDIVDCLIVRAERSFFGQKEIKRSQSWLATSTKTVFVLIGLPVAILSSSFSKIVMAEEVTRLTVIGKCSDPARNTACGWVEFLGLAQELLGFMIYLGVISCTVAIAYAGWLYLTAGDNESNVGKAKKAVWGAFIGFIWTLCAYLVVQFILKQLGVPSNWTILKY